MDWHRSVRRKGEMWMAEKITIKGKTIGAGTPCICVPVTEETADSIIEEIKLLSEKKTDMIEWRMDWFSQVTNRYEVQQILKEVQPVLKDTILLLTFRSQRQGGHMQLSSKEILDIYMNAAETGVPDMIDVSHWQGEIDWKKVYDSGIRYAYIKISQGNSLADDRCRENIRKARAAGIRVGVYHFFTTKCSAEEQFRWFCKL